MGRCGRCTRCASARRGRKRPPVALWILTAGVAFVRLALLRHVLPTLCQPLVNRLSHFVTALSPTVQRPILQRPILLLVSFEFSEAAPSRTHAHKHRRPPRPQSLSFSASLSLSLILREHSLNTLHEPTLIRRPALRKIALAAGGCC